MFAIAFYVLAFRYVQHSVDDFATSCVLAKTDLVGGNREFSARIGAAQERADFALSGAVDANTVFGQRMDQVDFQMARRRTMGNQYPSSSSLAI